MLRQLSTTAVASVIMLAATLVSPVTAAQIKVNSVQVNPVVRTDIGRTHVSMPNYYASSNIPNVPKQRKWVCGPIVNWDGTPHCHWGL
jgi:hypothetical protein